MRKDRIGKSLLAASLLGALVAASPAGVSVTPVAAAQANQPAPKSAVKFRRVRITADDIARLPRGESYVLYVGPGTRGRAGGYTGQTPVNSGVLNSTTEGGAYRSINKMGTGTTTLAGANNTSAREDSGLLINKAVANKVYEFRSDRPIDFGRVMVRAGADAAPAPLETWLRARLPAKAMAKWPFKSLVIGPALGVAQIKGWTANNPPGTNYECNGETCWCEGAFDCKPLIYSDKCDGELVCGDDDCFCEQKN